MNNRRVLLIYNTCGLLFEPNTKRWIEEIGAVLEQKMPGLHVVHSDCGSKKEFRDEIKSHFNNKISYYHTPENLPLQQTCNHAVRKIIEAIGEFDSYCYVGAGIKFNNKYQLAKAYKLLKENDDFCKIDFHVIRDPSQPPAEEMHPPYGFYPYLNANISAKYYQILPGQRVNNHVSLFSKEYCNAWDNRILPDAYAGNGAESIYAYLASSLNKKHVVMSYNYSPSVYHIPNMDGANQFLEEAGIPHRSYIYDWSFRGAVDLDKLNEAGRDVGLATDTPNFEPCAAQTPRPEFTKDGLPKTSTQRDKLFNLLQSSVFVEQSILNYDKISCEFEK